MAFKVRNFISDSPNPNIKVTSTKRGFIVTEYEKDMGLTPSMAVAAYYASAMNIRKRQLVIDLQASPVVLQAGAMQWTIGNVKMTSGINGVGDMVGKMFRGKVTGESAAKPVYSGSGIVVLEPTYKHLILGDASEWGAGVVLEDSMFLACEQGLKQTIVARSNLSSAVAGGEGFFNLCLEGQGVFCVESRCPAEDLVELQLQDDEVKIDGNYAVAWSKSLAFTVERSSRSLIGSAVSGEGLVNVYRGTGKIWMEPLAKMPDL